MIVLGAILLIWMPNDVGPIRELAALLLVLVFPGHAIVTALFNPSDLSLAERLLLTVGCSASVIILIGFLLHWTPWGLGRDSWLFALGAFVFLVGSVSWFRRVERSPVFYWRPSKFCAHIGSALWVSLAILCVIGAFGIARQGQVAQPQPAFSALWLLPAKSDTTVAKVGVINQEGARTNYRLELKVNDQTVMQWSSIQLEPGQQWETPIPASFLPPHAEVIEAALFRANEPKLIYREAALRLEAGGERP